jgi:hypothetical protein
MSETPGVVVAPTLVPNVEFVDSAVPWLRRRAHAGRVGWISGNATHTLTVWCGQPRLSVSIVGWFGESNVVRRLPRNEALRLARN